MLHISISYWRTTATLNSDFPWNQILCDSFEWLICTMYWGWHFLLLLKSLRRPEVGSSRSEQQSLTLKQKQLWYCIAGHRVTLIHTRGLQLKGSIKNWQQNNTWKNVRQLKSCASNMWRVTSWQSRSLVQVIRTTFRIVRELLRKRVDSVQDSKLQPNSDIAAYY